MVISLIRAIVSVMPPIESTASLVEACVAATCAEISSVAFAVWLASAFTSEATANKTVPVAILTELVSGDVYQWGALMAGSLPVAIFYSLFVD